MCCELGEYALILRAQQGDAQAMELLLRPHRPLVYSLSRRFHCPQSWQDELVQAGYMGLMQAVYHYDFARKVRLITYAVPWMLGEMKRTLRRLAAAADFSLEEELEEKGTPLRERLRGDEGIDIERIDLRFALGKLSGEEQQVICLRYYRGKTQKETACLLGCSQAQVSRKERCALDHLHELLA